MRLKIALIDNAVAVGVVKATLADIKAGSFVGIGAMPQADALEVLIFPESMRGVGEGHSAYDLAADKAHSFFSFTVCSGGGGTRSASMPRSSKNM